MVSVAPGRASHGPRQRRGGAGRRLQLSEGVESGSRGQGSARPAAQCWVPPGPAAASSVLAAGPGGVWRARDG